MISKLLNLKYNGTVPYRIGDRYYSQDRTRDMRFFQDQVGLLLKDLGNNIPCVFSGGVVTHGAGDTLNITACVGYAKFSVEIPDSFASLPPSKVSADIEAKRVYSTTQTNMAIPSATLDGGTPNYVKLRFKETDGNTRIRARAAGSYAYETIPDFEFIVDSVAPTDYDIVLNSFTGTPGGAFTFSGKSSPAVKLSGNSLPIGGVIAKMDYQAISPAHPYFYISAATQTLLAANFPEYVPYLRAIKLTYDVIGTPIDTFVIESWSAAAGVVSIVFKNLTAENVMLAGLAEDELFHGSYTNWRGINLVEPLRDAGLTIKVPAGEYAITGINPSTRTITFTYGTLTDAGITEDRNSEFYPYRIPGSSTSARHYQMNGATIMSGDDSNLEIISGLRRRDHGQGHFHEFYGDKQDAFSGGGTSSYTWQTIPYSGYVQNPLTDGIHGDPRIGYQTHPRCLGAYMYIYVGRYVV